MCRITKVYMVSHWNSLLYMCYSRSQTQTKPSANRFQYQACDAGSDPRWGWFGSGAETIYTCACCPTRWNILCMISLIPRLRGHRNIISPQAVEQQLLRANVCYMAPEMSADAILDVLGRHVHRPHYKQCTTIKLHSLCIDA